MENRFARFSQSRPTSYLLLLSFATLAYWFGVAFSLVAILDVSIPSTSEVRLYPESPLNDSYLYIWRDLGHRRLVYAAIIAVFLQTMIGLANSWKILPAPPGKRKVGYMMLFCRGLLAFASISKLIITLILMTDEISEWSIDFSP